MGHYNQGDYPSFDSTNPIAELSNWFTKGFVGSGCDLDYPLEAPEAHYTRFLGTDGLRVVGYRDDGVQGVIYDIQTGQWQTLSLPSHFDRGDGNMNGLVYFTDVFSNTIIGHYAYAYSPVPVEFVSVDDAGNEPDTNGYGAVSDFFGIGKYEATIEQYTAFLNDVASSDPYKLYNTNMASDLNVAGIIRSGVPGSYSYSVIGSGKRPVVYVSWFDAARFCNWVSNGADNESDTETGAYDLSGATNGIFHKNPWASCYLPSEDEWFKAAYYKGANASNTNAGYWTYPTQSDETPGNSVGTLSNQANFNNGVYSLTQSSVYSLDQNYLTDVGAFAASGSAYATFDQGGNVWEWNDAVDVGSRRGVRGGWYQDGNVALRSAWRSSELSTSEYKYLGFRVAGWRSFSLLNKSFKYDGTNWTSIEHPDWKSVEVTAILGSKILGNCHETDGDHSCFFLEGTNWTFFKPPFSYFSANDFEGSTIVGSWDDWNGSNGLVTHGFIFDGTNWVSKDFPEAAGETIFNAISEGKILGSYRNACGETVSFTYIPDASSGYSQTDYDLNRVVGWSDVVSNPNGFGLYSADDFEANRTNGHSDVVNSPGDFGLFTQAEYDGNFAAGQTDVVDNPA
ncbi:MAG: SUMF1/EgtB/PvdO family nonheme iron enzyme, partial [Akkermansiaceae bacterium]|nr:SUMF1/EgtB/PvdO family nonheme iron enzyme [Akkermansiaceae bacterium]